MVVDDLRFLVDVFFSELELHQPHVLTLFEQVCVDLFAVIFYVLSVFGFNFVEIIIRCFKLAVSVLLRDRVDFVVEFDSYVEIIDEILNAVGLI